MAVPVISNIQRYSIHDGKGIRTTVFFKGCPLDCRWCHNPETKSFRPEVMWRSELCRGCLTCVNVCTEGAVSAEKTGQGFRIITDSAKCSGCSACVDECIYNARSLSGKTLSAAELVKLLKRDVPFYESSGGGVTLSGGEVMAQDMEYITETVRLLHGAGISVNIDTCGMAPIESFEKILPYVDTFLYDIKAMDAKIHKHYTGADNRIILENLCRLSERKAKIALRLPFIPGVNAGEENALAVIKFLKENSINPDAVHLLAYHELGSEKNVRLSKAHEMEKFEIPSEEELKHIADLYIKAGFGPVQIGG